MTSTPSLRTLAGGYAGRLAKHAASAPLKPQVKPPSLLGGNSGVAKIPSLVSQPKVPTLSTTPTQTQSRLGEGTARQVEQTAQNLRPQSGAQAQPQTPPAPQAPQAPQAPVQPQAPQPPLGPLGVPVMSKTGFLGYWAAPAAGCGRGLTAAPLTPPYRDHGGLWEGLAARAEGVMSEDGKGFGKVGEEKEGTKPSLVLPIQCQTSSLFKQGFEERLYGKGVASRLLRSWYDMGLRGVKLAAAIGKAASMDPAVRDDFLKLADNSPLKMDPATSPLSTESLGAPKVEAAPAPVPPAPVPPAPVPPAPVPPAPVPPAADRPPQASSFRPVPVSQTVYTPGQAPTTREVTVPQYLPPDAGSAKGGPAMTPAASPGGPSLQYAPAVPKPPTASVRFAPGVSAPAPDAAGGYDPEQLAAWDRYQKYEEQARGRGGFSAPADLGASAAPGFGPAAAEPVNADHAFLREQFALPPGERSPVLKEMLLKNPSSVDDASGDGLSAPADAPGGSWTDRSPEWMPTIAGYRPTKGDLAMAAPLAGPAVRGGRALLAGGRALGARAGLWGAASRGAAGEAAGTAAARGAVTAAPATASEAAVAGARPVVMGTGEKAVGKAVAQQAAARSLGTTAAEASVWGARPAVATAQALTRWGKARQVGAALLDPLGSAGAGLYRAGQGTGVVPFLARWGERLTRPLTAVPRYLSGSAAWGNTLRRGVSVNTFGAGLTPIMASGLTGSSPLEAMAAPLTYLGRWYRGATDVVSGDPAAAAKPYEQPLQGLRDNTLRPLDRVTGNAVQHAEHWYDPVAEPAAFVGGKVLGGVRNVIGANANAFENPDIKSTKAIEKAMMSPEAIRRRDEEGAARDPADPGNQHRLTDRLPTWLGGQGGVAGEEVLRGRADEVVSELDKGVPRPPGGAAAAPEPTGFTPDDLAKLEGDYGEALAAGDPNRAKAVFESALARAGGDASKVPMGMLVGDLGHEMFPGMTPEQYGAAIDAGLGAGAYQKYTAARDEANAAAQKIAPLRQAGRPVPPDLQAEFDRAVAPYEEMHKKVQGQALAHYENTVMKDVLEKQVPAFEREYEEVKKLMASRPPGAPDPELGSRLVAMREQGRELTRRYTDFAMRKAIQAGGFKADGTPVKTMQDFLGEADRTTPVLGPDGRPLTQLVRLADGGVAEQPVTEPASPIGKEIKARIDADVLARVRGQRTGVDDRGRPVIDRQVPPGVGAGVFGAMSPTEKMLTFGGLGLGAVGLLGMMFGFGGSWLPVLGLLGAAFGGHKATGGDFGKLFKKDFWAGLGRSREDLDRDVLTSMGDATDPLLGASPVGQVGLDGLKSLPQYGDLVAGRLPSREAVQYLAALQPADRARLRSELQAGQPGSPLLPMIRQVDEFHADRQRELGAVRAMNAPAAPPAPAPGGGPAPAARPVSAATSIAQFAAENSIPMRDGLQDLAGRSVEDMAGMVGRMSPGLRDQARGMLEAKIREKDVGWPTIQAFAEARRKPDRISPDEWELAKTTWQLKRLLDQAR